MTEPLAIQPIYAYAGTTFEECIILKNEQKEVQRLSDGDVMILGIRPHYSDTCIIERTWTADDEADGAYIIHITPEEMDMVPDEYKYDIGIQTSDGDFYRIIPESPFTVLSSSTKKMV